MISQFPAFSLSDYSASHKVYLVLYKVLSCAPTAPSRLPCTSALSAYILRSVFVFHCYSFLSAPTRISNRSNSVLLYLYHINLFPKEILAHSRTIIFFSISVTVSLPYLVISCKRLERLAAFSARSKFLLCSTIDCTRSSPKYCFNRPKC